jgi:multidrug efflux pump subunit AcrA (membrane-fusion protein)
MVEKGQLLALVDTEMACDDLESKLASIEVAESERETSQKAKEEAYTRYGRIVMANTRNPGTFAPEDVSGAKLAYDRYVQEEVAKKAAIVKAQRQTNAAITLLNRHAIHAPVAGVIKVIDLQAGEGVKKLETVLEILPREE